MGWFPTSQDGVCEFLTFIQEAPRAGLDACMLVGRLVESDLAAVIGRRLCSRSDSILLLSLLPLLASCADLVRRASI